MSIITRRQRFRVPVVGVAVAAAAVVLVASAAWACTPDAQFFLERSSGQPGDRSLVTGVNFFAKPRRGALGLESGPVLATAMGSNLKAHVTIPSNAAPGTYTIVAVQRDPDGTTVWHKAAAFTVKGTTTTPTTSLQESTPVEPVAEPEPAPASQASAVGVPVAAGQAPAAGGSVSAPVALALSGAGDTPRRDTLPTSAVAAPASPAPRVAANGAAAVAPALEPVQQPVTSPRLVGTGLDASPVVGSMAGAEDLGGEVDPRSGIDEPDQCKECFRSDERRHTYTTRRRAS